MADDNSPKEAPARLSPWVSAPRLSNLRATEDTNLLSPPSGVNSSLYSGQLTWFDLWERPNCWMAFSALQGSSKVRWTLWRWFLQRLRQEENRWSRLLRGTQHRQGRWNYHQQTRIRKCTCSVLQLQCNVGISGQYYISFKSHCNLSQTTPSSLTHSTSGH